MKRSVRSHTVRRIHVLVEAKKRAFLDRDARLRGSIVVPTFHPEAAADRGDLIAQRNYFPGFLNANVRRFHARPSCLSET